MAEDVADSELQASVRRMQEFDTQTLSQVEKLGQVMSFAEVLGPAQRLVALYKRISLDALNDLSEGLANQVKQHADANYNRFQQILSFDPNQNEPGSVRQNLTNEIIAAYDPTFNSSHPIISYGISKTTDFQSIETDARAMLQNVKDQGENVAKELEGMRDQSQEILEEVRRVAAEQGVSQQARYFKEESDEHNTESDKWQKRTYGWAALLGVYAIASLFLHKIPILEPATTYQSIVLVSSKVLIFAVLSYLVFLSAKNFLSHKHNSIVNRHRQNALMTFQALADAAGDESKDVILMYAASCIFASQETGYTKGTGAPGGTAAKSIIELIPKPTMRVEN